MREPWGGLNPYRSRYGVFEPLRFHSTVGHLHDEVQHYRRFRDRAPTPRAENGLRVLLVGELAHNPERILALSERGHELFGLWTDTPVWFNSVGPLPFGHVAEVPREGWREAVSRLQPDVVYALLTGRRSGLRMRCWMPAWGSPSFGTSKRALFFAREHGLWRELADLHTRSDGDLPKAEWLVGERSPLLSGKDGAVHTVIPGRPIGPDPEVLGTLARANIHVHLYSEKAASQMREWVAEVKRVAPRHFHLHPQVDQEDWVAEFSQYDAGWLHSFVSTVAQTPAT